jgi:Uma2 family endonuclease
VDRLAEIFTDQRNGRYRVGVQNPLRLDDASEPQPDLVLYARAVDARHPTPAESFLAVEMADASLDYDQGAKIPLYAAVIREIWVIDLVRNLIHSYRDADSLHRAYNSIPSCDRLTRTSPLEFPDVHIRLAECFNASPFRVYPSPLTARRCSIKECRFLDNLTSTQFNRPL